MSRLRLPYATAAILDAATPQEREIVFDTDADEVRIGDGTTVGGIKLGKKAASSSTVIATGSTTSRTLAARFAEVGNVKDFGALGDGSTDDTAAIEASLAVWDSIYLPKGVYMLGSRLDVPAGKKIYGAGFDDTILRASATGYNGMTVGSNCVLLDFTIDGNNLGGAHAGILYDGVSACFTDRVWAKNWGAHGFAITNAAHHNKFGDIYATTNGSRGVIIDPNCYSNQFDSIDTRGSINAGLLIGHNSYRNQVGLLICGGHQNSALWIHNAAYENQVDSVIVEAPATGYENNSAILFGWGALRNTIGQATVTGWRRGVQFKGDDADATYTDSDTSYNHIGALYVTTDNGTSAAGVYLDANNGYFAKKNSIGKLHVKSATYGIWDASGTNYPNDFDIETATFESVTTPLSITLDIASATTTDLSTVNDGAYARITGTTTITGLGTAPMNTRRTVRFAAALTLTHNGASLILPGSASITTAADDTAEFVSLGSGNWLCLWYKRASGQPVAQVPISTGVSGLAANIAAFLATPSSANLAAAMTDETGTGANVFANSPTLVTPVLGTPASGTLTNCTGLPASTGISGGSGTYTPTLTGVANVGSSTAYTCQYIRIGSVVTVSGKVDVDPTSAATLTQLGVTLPISSDLAADSQLQGTTCSNGGANGYGNVRGDATNNRAELFFVPSVDTNNSWSFTFTYLIV